LGRRLALAAEVAPGVRVLAIGLDREHAVPIGVDFDLQPTSRQADPAERVNRLLLHYLEPTDFHPRLGLFRNDRFLLLASFLWLPLSFCANFPNRALRCLR